MKLNILYFTLFHFNAILLAVWIIFLIIVALRFFRPQWVRNISFWKLSLIAIGINIFYGLFVTWGQYYVWAHGSEFTQSLLNSPLPPQVPIWEWARPFFSHSLGYFAFYVLGRTWLNVLISFIISGVLYSLFKIWSNYRGNFIAQGPELLLVLMLISGYPGILILIPVGFILAILFFGFSYLEGKRGNIILNIEPAFIFATLIVLLFSRIILSMLY